MEACETIGITMTADTMRPLRQAVASGEFASAADTLEHAVRVWQQQTDASVQAFADIKARIRRSIDDPRPSLSAENTRAEMEEFMNSRVDVLRRAAD